MLVSLAEPLEDDVGEASTLPPIGRSLLRARALRHGPMRAYGAPELQPDADRASQPSRPPHRAGARSRPSPRPGRSAGRRSAERREMPVAASSASAPGPRAPHSRTTGVSRERASVATPTAALPCSVCSSARPSPVMTRSASSSASARPTSSATTSTPGRTRARGEAEQPGRRAARGPGSGQVRHEAAGRATRSPGRTSPGRRRAPPPPPRRRPSAVRRSRPLHASRTACSSRRTRRQLDAGQPRVQAADVDPVEVRERAARRRAGRRRIGRGIGRRARADSPEPPSVVADPPRPMVMRSTPASSAARTRSPVPCVEAVRAFVRRSLARGPGARVPDAAAISTKAPRPPSRRSQSAVIGRPSASVVGAASPLGGRPECVGHGREGPLATVGHRLADHLVVRSLARPPGRDGGGHADGVEGPAERVRRHHDPKRSTAGVDHARPRIPSAPAVGPHRRGWKVASAEPISPCVWRRSPAPGASVGAAGR